MRKSRQPSQAHTMLRNDLLKFEFANTATKCNFAGVNNDFTLIKYWKDVVVIKLSIFNSQKIFSIKLFTDLVFNVFK